MLTALLGIFMLGFLSRVTIHFKVFIQELCKSKLSWEQLLEGEALIKWCSIVDGLARSQPTTIPRYCNIVYAHTHTHAL